MCALFWLELCKTCVAIFLWYSWQGGSTWCTAVTNLKSHHWNVFKCLQRWQGFMPSSAVYQIKKGIYLWSWLKVICGVSWVAMVHATFRYVLFYDFKAMVLMELSSIIREIWWGKRGVQCMKKLAIENAIQALCSCCSIHFAMRKRCPMHLMGFKAV